jgi:hypothetical protein
MRQYKEQYGFVDGQTADILSDVSKYISTLSQIMCKYLMADHKGKSEYTPIVS